MKKRDIFVFCGQSNMMGQGTLPPKHSLDIKDSLEFKYNKQYIGAGPATFQRVGYDCGEFSYCDIDKAYPDKNQKSTLGENGVNAYFTPPLSNYTMGYADMTESNCPNAPCMVPYFCERYEQLGEKPIVAHMAKGNVNIIHYFSREMIEEYNRLKPAAWEALETNPMQEGAHRFFTQKSLALFDAAAEKFGDAVGKKVFVWLQGESNAKDSKEEYKLKLEILHRHLKAMGFDHFFCVRVGYWGSPKILDIILAQEEFCRETENACIISRAVSHMPDCRWHLPENWFRRAPGEDYLACRDTYYGHPNPHINEKGQMLVGREVAENAYRVLIEELAPELGEELLSGVSL